MSKVKVKHTRLARIVSNEQGFTLTEVLAAVAIMSLVSMCMAMGVHFAVKQYHNSMVQSESKVLCSTLTAAIQEELSNTRTVSIDGGGNVTGFFSSITNGKDSKFYTVSVDEDNNVTKLAEGEYGKLYLENDEGGRLLLSNAAYSSYNLGARLDSLAYDKDNKVFHATLSIGLNGNEITSSSFDVKPYNEMKVE